MINFDDVTKENTNEHNTNWSQFPDLPYRMLIIRSSRYGKTNSWFSLINEKSDIDTTYLYAKNPQEAKYQFLINKRESTGLKHFNESKAFTEYSNDMDDIYKKHWKIQS